MDVSRNTPEPAIALPRDEIVRICRAYDVEELSLFGSALRPDFRSDSDLDFLVRFRGNDCGPWLSKLTDMQEQLSRLLGRPVDLVNKPGIEQSRNPIRREHILRSARLIYEG